MNSHSSRGRAAVGSSSTTAPSATFSILNNGSNPVRSNKKYQQQQQHHSHFLAQSAIVDTDDLLAPAAAKGEEQDEEEQGDAPFVKRPPQLHPPSASASFPAIDLVARSTPSRAELLLMPELQQDGDETEDDDEHVAVVALPKATRERDSSSDLSDEVPQPQPIATTKDPVRSLRVRLTMAGSAVASTSTIPYQRRRSISPSKHRDEVSDGQQQRPTKKLRLASTITGSHFYSEAPASALLPPSSTSMSKMSKKKDKKKKKKVNRKQASTASDDFAFSTSSHRRKRDSNTATSSPSSSATPAARRPLPTPARSSLRQVLQASVREISASRDSSPAPSLDRRRRKPVDDNDDDDATSDDDLDSEADEEIEKAEEKALREEFERGSTATTLNDNYSSSNISSSCSENNDSDSSEEDFEEGWEERARERAEDRLRTKDFLLHDADSTSPSWLATNLHSRRERSVGCFSVDMDAEGDEAEAEGDSSLREIPEKGGRGVVTWSDYDSVEDSDPDEDAGEFEDELEQLLALSEAVVGPVQEYEYEFGEMWFEEMSVHGDDESGSADDDSGSSSGSEDDDDRTLTLMDGFHRAVGDSSEDSSDEDDDDEEDSDGHQYGFDFDDEDEGDTTDSLDSDDHVGLVRFGIEVDTDSSATDSDSDSEFFSLPPGTISLATVQPPTSADLAALPQTQYLLSSNMGLEEGCVEMMIDLQDLEQDPSRAIRDAARGLGVNRGTAARILGGVDRAWLQQGYPPLKERGNGSIEQELREERRRVSISGTTDATATASSSAASSRRSSTARAKDGSCTVGGTAGPSGPSMGSFMPKPPVKGRGKGKSELSLVIDGSDTIAPSPFSKVKKGKKRARDLLDGTPSRRSRADSKVSTISAHSATDRSVSGELADLESPRASPKLADFDIDDVLHASILGEKDAASEYSSSDEHASDSRIPKDLRIPSSASTTMGLSDLSRWSRVPIGAFRNNSTASTIDGVAGLKGHHHVNSNKAATLFSPKSHKVRRPSSSASRLATSTLAVVHHYPSLGSSPSKGLGSLSNNGRMIGRGIDHHSPLFKTTTMTSSPLPLSLDSQ